ncbi:glycosyltransferase family 2 protein [Mucilaginibacter koreensis]
MAKSKCSLLISTYNWPAALALCLQSVAGQTQLPDEVIIADDGSGQETTALIKQFQAGFPVPLYHVWHKDEGFRKTIILNKAVSRSQSDYVIQIDGDVILNRHFIADHLYIREPGTFIRGTRGMLTAGKTQALLQQGRAQLNAFSAGVEHRFNALRLPLLSSLMVKKEKSSRQVRGSNFAFWKADFAAVNGYDNTIAGWGHEDEELATRLINYGLVKKSVKLLAVQFHLHHSGDHRNSALEQRSKINHIKAQHISVCADGYSQCLNYE